MCQFVRFLAIVVAISWVTSTLAFAVETQQARTQMPSVSPSVSLNDFLFRLSDQNRPFLWSQFSDNENISVKFPDKNTNLSRNDGLRILDVALRMLGRKIIETTVPGISTPVLLIPRTRDTTNIGQLQSAKKEARKAANRLTNSIFYGSGRKTFGRDLMLDDGRKITVILYMEGRFDLDELAAGLDECQISRSLFLKKFKAKAKVRRGDRIALENVVRQHFALTKNLRPAAVNNQELTDDNFTQVFIKALAGEKVELKVAKDTRSVVLHCSVDK